MNSFFKCQKFLQNIFFQTPVVQKFLHLGFKKFHQSTSSNRHFIFSWDNNSFQTSEGLQAATRNNMDSTNFIEEIEAQFILRVLVKYWPEGILSHFHTAWGKSCTVTLSKYHIRGPLCYNLTCERGTSNFEPVFSYHKAGSFTGKTGTKK